MHQQMIFVNLFIVPLIGMYLFVRRNNQSFNFSLKVVFIYAYFICLNIPVTRLFMIIARKFNYIVVLDSGVYTLIAMLSSFVVYIILYIFTEILHVQFRVNRKNEK